MEVVVIKKYGSKEVGQSFDLNESVAKVLIDKGLLAKKGEEVKEVTDIVEKGEEVKEVKPKKK